MTEEETFNLALEHHARGDLIEAERLYRAALALRPDEPRTHWNLGLLLLLKGDFAAGWPEYAWRWQLPQLRVQRLQCRQPEWRGQDLRGKRILVYAEQGAGDSIQFARYIPLLAQAGANIWLGCQQPLAPLLQSIQGVEKCWPQPGPVPAEFDFHCSLPTLPAVMQTIPHNVPYLSAHEARRAAWKARLPPGGFSLGLCWAGSPAHRDDARRSIAPAYFAPFSQIPGVRLFSLQKNPAAGGFPVADFSADLTDFAETAALIANLDLVITVDTAVAHLAGAMARPVWLLLPHLPDWRWMLNRSDSPWYPTMRLFRQCTPGDWSTPIAAAAGALADLAGLRSA